MNALANIATLRCCLPPEIKLQRTLSSPCCWVAGAAALNLCYPCGASRTHLHP
uniref:Uncharacterized protein n=1 Tax=Arundo donax TaxID=35708 RepID=A0A0A9BQH9_ARUDO